MEMNLVVTQHLGKGLSRRRCDITTFCVYLSCHSSDQCPAVRGEKERDIIEYEQ